MEYAPKMSLDTFADILSESFDNEFSDKFRKAGNGLFKQERFIAAIAQYNHALVFGRKDPARAALCYGNRSAVYLKLNYFGHCLNNIKLAEKDYPRENIQKLIDRREQCKQMMKDHPDKAMKPFEHSFRLSYEANPKIPFFIDAIKFDKVNDRIITTKDLKAGDVIAILEDTWGFPVNDLNADYILPCYNCVSMNDGDLIPGECFARFCSEKCRDEHKAKDVDHEQMHRLEKISSFQDIGIVKVYRIFLRFRDLFGNTNELCKFVEAHKNKSYNFFDFDWSIDPDSPEYLKNTLLLIIRHFSKIIGSATSPPEIREGFAAHWRQFDRNRFAEIFLDDTPRNLKFIDRFISLLLAHCRMKMGFVAIQKEHVQAEYWHQAMSLLGCSCDPNVFPHFDCNKRIVWTVNQPITAGSQLTGFPTTNGAPYYRPQSETCKREMNCLPCKKGWSKQIDFMQIDVDAEFSMMDFFKKHDPTELASNLQHIQECSDFINRKFDGYYKKDSRTRQKIASKKEEMRKSLNSIPCPLPAYGLPFVSKMPFSEKRNKYMMHFGT